MNKLLVLLSHGFYLGYAPVASGTFGTLLGLPLAWFLNTRFGVPGQIAAAAVLTLIAVPVCQAAETFFGKKDPGRCVADEYLTFPICMIGLPVWGQEHGLVMMGVAFLTNRFFDILKIWPAHGLQALKGGVGITIDDVFAALYSLAVNHAILWLALRQGWL